MCKIKFEIKSPGAVAIKVVDIIGKPITTLVNDYNYPGNYEVDFNDDQLMPGRYYYKIFSQVVDSNQTAPQINGFDKLLQTGTLKIGAGESFSKNDQILQ
jgi:hypothetical protein